MNIGGLDIKSAQYYGVDETLNFGGVRVHITDVLFLGLVGQGKRFFLTRFFRRGLGDGFNKLIDLGGVVVLSLRHSEFDALADQLSQSLTEHGESLESMLQALREALEKYGE